MATNLPIKRVTDSAAATKLFFNTFGQKVLGFPATEVTAAVNFFEKRGFDQSAAIVTASTILKQAKVEGVSVFNILDNLKGFTDLQISSLVAQILNSDRVSTSTLGYTSKVESAAKIRNISA